MSFIYINIEQAIETHKLTVNISGGGSDGILDVGNISKEFLLEIVTSILNEPDFSEELKLKILYAISE